MGGGPRQVLPLRLAAWTAIGVTTIVGASFAFADARFAYLRSTNPEKAYSMRPNDADALGNALSRRIGLDKANTISPADATNARLALRNAPLNRSVFKVLGVQADLGRRPKAAAAYMTMGDRLSRRDSFTQLWLIEYAVQRGDIENVLSHYDAVLAVHPEMGRQLYPILASAISQSDIRQALAPYVRRQARWINDFVDAAAGMSQPEDVARLLLDNAESIHIPDFQSSIANLIGRLAQAGKLDLAQQIAMRMVPGFDPQALRTLALNERTADQRLGLLAWSFPDGGGISVVPNTFGGFDVSVEPLARGIAASRVIAVRPSANYRLNYTLGDVPGSEMVEGRWIGSCVPIEQSTKIVIQHALPRSGGAKHVDVPLQIPAGCLALQLVLELRGSEGQQASAVSIRSLSLNSQQ